MSGYVQAIAQTVQKTGHADPLLGDDAEVSVSRLVRGINVVNKLPLGGGHP